MHCSVIFCDLIWYSIYSGTTYLRSSASGTRNSYPRSPALLLGEAFLECRWRYFTVRLSPNILIFLTLKTNKNASSLDRATKGRVPTFWKKSWNVLEMKKLSWNVLESCKMSWKILEIHEFQET